MAFFLVECQTTSIPAEPTVDFSIENDNCTASCEVRFFSKAQNVAKFTWDFGDGGTSTEANPKHTYLNPGTYTVKLVVQGSGGMATQTKTVTIGNRALSGQKVWDKSFGGSNTEDFKTLLATADGGTLLGGTSVSPSSGNKSLQNYGERDYWIVKLNQAGDKVWEKTFGGINDDYFQSMVATEDGGFLLAGRSYSSNTGNKTVPNYGQDDYWVVKINASGEKVWDKTFGGSSNDELRSIVVTADGGALLGGFSRSPVSGNKTASLWGSFDSWVVKINASGDKLWEKSFGGTELDYLFSMVTTADGGALLGGASTSPVSGNKTAQIFGGIDYWVVKINAAGDKVWDKSFGGTGSDWLNSMVNTQDGGMLLGGETQSPVSGNKTVTNAGGSDQWLVKINASGDKLWEKVYGGSDSEMLYSIIATSDGGFLLGGHSTSVVSGNKSSDGFGGWDSWVVKINSTGEKTWDRSFGGSSTDWLYSMAASPDGGVFIGIDSRSPASGNKTAQNYGDTDYWIVKIN